MQAAHRIQSALAKQCAREWLRDALAQLGQRRSIVLISPAMVHGSSSSHLTDGMQESKIDDGGMALHDHDQSFTVLFHSFYFCISVKRTSEFYATDAPVFIFMLGLEFAYACNE